MEFVPFFLLIVMFKQSICHFTYGEEGGSCLRDQRETRSRSWSPRRKRVEGEEGGDGKSGSQGKGSPRWCVGGVGKRNVDGQGGSGRGIAQRKGGVPLKTKRGGWGCVWKHGRLLQRNGGWGARLVEDEGGSLKAPVRAETESC